jgi:hypothetical protein
MFVGLELKWDDYTYIRGSEYNNIVSHHERTLDQLTDADTIRGYNYIWYSVNPYGWEPLTYYSYYSVTTGYWKFNSIPDDPSYKWNYPAILPYDWQLSDGQTFSIEGQVFNVSGPHSGYTAFGKQVFYWELVNRDKFLYWDGGGDWTQYIHPGDITIKYDTGNTRVYFYSNILRRIYFQGQFYGDTIQYIKNLMSANSFPTSNPTMTKEE